MPTNKTSIFMRPESKTTAEKYAIDSYNGISIQCRMQETRKQARDERVRQARGRQGPQICVGLLQKKSEADFIQNFDFLRRTLLLL